MFVKSDEVHSEPRSKKAKRAILEYLEERKKVRATELKKEVCDHVLPLSRICSKKIFYRCLSELVKSKRIIKNERNRGNVSYYKPDWTVYENMINTDVIKQGTSTVRILAEVGRHENEVMQLTLLKMAFGNIMGMYASITLIAQQPDKAKTSAVITSTLKNTIPELLEMFSIALEKCGKNRSRVLSSLMDYRDENMGGGWVLENHPDFKK